MPSGKQRARAIRASRRKVRAARVVETKVGHRPNTAPVNREALAPNNSYGEPVFATRGYYEDTPFRCVDCGKDEVWTATQQKWWYEVAKGYVYSLANRCRPCRRAKRSGITPAR